MAQARDDEPKLSLVTLVNDERMYGVCKATLDAQHPERDLQWIPVRADARGWNAAQGLNFGLEEAKARFIVCVHQDVLFPNGWWERARNALRSCSPRFGVAGLVGVTEAGGFAGHVLDPHGHHRWGTGSQPVMSLDEHLLILDRDSGLRFDPSIPGFHCYGTDIALQARDKGFEVFALDAPVVHLSGGTLDRSYREAASVLLAKWGDRLGGVIPTPASIVLDRRPGTWWRHLRVRLERRKSRAGRICRCTDIHVKSSRIAQ